MSEENDNTSAVETTASDLVAEELRKEHERYIRLLSDFENYRRRVERERETAARADKRTLLLSVLEVVDDFDRALQHIDAMPVALAEGVQGIRRKLDSVLEGQGVTPFYSLGRKFDPEVHEAIGSVESEQYPPGVVAEEVRRGYRWGDELLRPARVVVAR